MIAPVAARLRNLLAEDPSRSACSLLITGHSAGGAVAALLYSHMLATSSETESELNILTGCFKRIHCVTFGAPPVSLLPLARPERRELRHSVFLSFVNEGDPVVRADKAYVKSLLELYAAPAPAPTNTSNGNNNNSNKTLPAPPAQQQKPRPPPRGSKTTGASSTSLALRKTRPTPPPRSKSDTQVPSTAPAGPIWPIPASTLSNAGRLILLRSVPIPEHFNSHSYSNGTANGKNRDADMNTAKDNSERERGLRGSDARMNDGVQARIVTDEQLRGVIWGDPVCHMMKLYARRIEILATNAVVGNLGIR